MLCKSCDKVLHSSEMFRTVVLEDGSTIEIIDDFCHRCLDVYIYRADELDTHEYAFEYMTEGYNNDFCKDHYED